MTDLKINRERGDAEFAHALVFTGHMIDRAGRAEPRFPEWAEERARAAIREAILGLRWERLGETLGIAGAASGGDLLFHEVCGELGIATRVLLGLPVEEFVEASVAPAGAGWVERFRRLLERRAGSVFVMGERDGLLEGATENVWQRANLWMIEEATALAPERMLLALWDGKMGDGPGGTEHMANAARRFGVEVAAPIAMQKVIAEMA